MKSLIINSTTKKLNTSILPGFVNVYVLHGVFIVSNIILSYFPRTSMRFRNMFDIAILYLSSNLLLLSTSRMHFQLCRTFIYRRQSLCLYLCRTYYALILHDMSIVHTGVAEPIPIRINLSKESCPVRGQLKAMLMQIRLIWIETLSRRLHG